jgi:hypothetical protein
VDGLLGGHSGRGAERPDPGLGPHAAAEGLAIEEAGAQPMEEAQVHGAAGEHAVWARVVEGDDGLGTVRRHDRGESRVDQVQGFLPARGDEAPFALGAHAEKGRGEASGSVDELRIRLGDLGADHAGGVGVGARAAHLDDSVLLNGDGEAAGVGAIEGAHAGALSLHRASPG